MGGGLFFCHVRMFLQELPSVLPQGPCRVPSLSLLSPNSNHPLCASITSAETLPDSAASTRAGAVPSSAIWKRPGAVVHRGPGDLALVSLWGLGGVVVVSRWCHLPSCGTKNPASRACASFCASSWSRQCGPRSGACEIKGRAVSPPKRKMDRRRYERPDPWSPWNEHKRQRTACQPPLYRSTPTF